MFNNLQQKMGVLLEKKNKKFWILLEYVIENLSIFQYLRPLIVNLFHKLSVQCISMINSSVKQRLHLLYE